MQETGRMLKMPRTMKKDNAPGPSAIMTKTADSIVEQGLPDLFNRVITEGHIPDEWKSSSSV